MQPTLSFDERVQVSVDTIQPVMSHSDSMRRAARTDTNQIDIVRALRSIGANVEVTSGIGNGFPDLVVMFRHRVTFVEIKDGSRPPSQRLLTDREQEFSDRCAVHCPGLYRIVTSPADAIAAVMR